MGFIGKQPTPVPLTASDIADGIISTSKLADTSVTNAKLNADIISGETELATAPADTDEFLISDAGVLKRLDASLVGGGKILQIVSQQYTSPITVSGVTNTFVDSTITASITPSSSSNKVIVFFNVSVANTSSTGNRIALKLKRGSTDIAVTGDSIGSRIGATAAALYESNDPYEPMTVPMIWYDTPATTSATTYKVAVASNNNNSQSVYFNRSRDDTNNNDNFRTVTQVLLVDVAG